MLVRCLKDAPIVLLDESTASIDVENETKIQSRDFGTDKRQNRADHRSPKLRTVANAHKI